MKNLKKLSKVELKNVNGGKMMEAAHCTSNAGCPSHQICLTCSGSNCGNLGTGICI